MGKWQGVKVGGAVLWLVAAAASAAAAAPSGEGEALYQQHCAGCHAANLRGSAHGTALKGPAFIDKWGGRSSLDLLRFNMANMPPGESDRLTPEQHAAVAGFLLDYNREGNAPDLPLLASAGELQALVEDESWYAFNEAGSIAEAAMTRGGWENRPVEGFRPVTDAMLANPAPGDWPNWRRTLDGQGFSPLDQVNRDTVGRLTLAWAVTMKSGSNQGTPLVHDGIMYLTHPGAVIQALKADTGDLLWEFAYQYPPDSQTLGGPQRNIALYDDKLFLATYDAAIVAIDARTGRQLWRTAKADYKQAYTHTAGPIVGGGVVLSGINGCELYKREGCFITGHDPATGKELWRTSTIARPGEPGGDTWGGLPAEFRAGGDVWIAGSYDPSLDLFFVGISQAKPWVAASRGTTPRDRSLYTNSTLAIEAKTGRIAWHFQHVPGETIDMETAFERVLVDIDGTPVLLTVGKDGLLWKLDRRDGKFLGVVETLPQDLFAHIDRKTGRVTYRDDIIDSKIGDTIKSCPGIYGGHNWQASAYHPSSRLLVVPLHQLCSDLVGREVAKEIGGGGYGGDSRTYEMPGTDGMVGRLAAFDASTLKERWAHQQRAMFLTGALTTGGGLVFIGDLDRYFKAFDVDTGKALWQTRLGAPLHGFPVTYAVDGKQYIAVPTGIGVFRAMSAVVTPDIYQPTGGEALYVFALPGD